MASMRGGQSSWQRFPEVALKPAIMGIITTSELIESLFCIQVKASGTHFDNNYGMLAVFIGLDSAKSDWFLHGVPSVVSIAGI